MHSQIFMDFTEFLAVICDIISNSPPPPPLSTYEVIYALRISFSLQKGNHNVTEDVWSSVLLIYKEFLPVFQVMPDYVRCTMHAPMVYYISTEQCA